MQPGIEDVVYNILKSGHYVNITTNGTVGEQIRKILKKNKEMLNRLHFSLSFHYLELRRLNLLDAFFENIDIIRTYGGGTSFFVQLNFCDEYIPYLEEINNLCIRRLGASPQIAVTRKETSGLRKIDLLTSLSKEEYQSKVEMFQSPFFKFSMEHFNVRSREFCYAGDWSGNIDLSTGIMRRCYCSYIRQDIFKNPQKPIQFIAVGNACGSPYCMNASHFLSMGVIPSIKTPTYASLRNRSDAGWYTPGFKMVLNKQLIEENSIYNSLQKFEANLLGIADTGVRTAVQLVKKYGGEEK